MLSLPPPLVRLPRALLEHPLPLCGPGLCASLTYQSPSGSLFSLTLGLVDRWQRADSSPSPGFNLENFSLLCALLTLTERRDGVTLTFNQLFRALTGSRSLCSAHHRESLKHTLSTLESLDTSLIDLSTPSAAPAYQRLLHITPTVTAPVFGQRAPAFIVHFAPSFLACLDDPRASTLFDFSTFRTLRSRLSRVLYATLSTWAHYNRASPSRPFRITLSRLITHLGSTPPRFLSQRRAFFAGHRRAPVLAVLHNLPTPHGLLQLSLSNASSVDDDLLNIWFSQAPSPLNELRALPSNSPSRNEFLENPLMPNARSCASSASADEIFAPSLLPPAKSLPVENRDFSHPGIQKGHIPFAGAGQRPPPAPASHDPLSSFRHLKIYQAWSTSGRLDTDFIQRVRTPSVTLTQEDLELLHAARISPSRCESFLLLSKKLLPQRTWLDLLGEAKYAALSTTPPKNPTGKLITEILSSVRSAI